MNRMNSSIAKFTLISALLILSQTVFAQGSKKKSLAGLPVSKIELKYDESKPARPGPAVRIGVSATLEDGSVLKTKGWLDGKIKWSDFNLEVLGGTQGGTLESGTIIVSSNSSDTKDHVVKITARSVHDPNLTTTALIPIDSTQSFTASFNGANGANGSAGQKGNSGEYDGSMYDKPKGDTGKPGQNGGNGSSGKAGEDAPDVKVYVTTTTHKITSEVLLQVVVKDADSKTTYYIFNPNGGSLHISANGGNGGSGGNGGAGGDGGKGQWVKSDERKQIGGDGGDGGNGGDGGPGADGGNGGTITIYYDPSAQDYLDKISTSNKGGSGGSGGSSGSGGSAGVGGSGYNSGKHGAPGKSGSANSQKGSSGTNGPDVVKIKQPVDLKAFGIE